MKDENWRNRITLEKLAAGCWYAYVDLPSNLEWYSQKSKYRVHYGVKWWGIHKAKKLIRLQEKGFNIKR